MEIFLIWLFCAILCALIASNRNRSIFGWFIIGFFFGPFGALFAFFMKRGEVANEELIKDGERSIKKEEQNGVYYIEIKNFKNDDFEIIKNKLFEQYQSDGFDKIEIDTENVFLLKKSLGDGYIQIRNTGTILYLELNKVTFAPIINFNGKKIDDDTNSQINESSTDKLLKLSALYDKGLISKEEFLAHKNQI